MKNNLHTNPLLFKLIVLVTCFMLVILYNKSKAGDITPVAYSHSRVAVSFSHSLERNELKVTVKANTGANFQLFIFSTDGLLVKEVAVSTQKITTIKNLKRGIYLFDCFDKDTRLTSGSLTIK